MASTDIQLLFLVISNYYRKTIHTNGVPYNVSICIISKSGKKHPIFKYCPFMVNCELLSYSEMHYILLSSLSILLCKIPGECLGLIQL